MISIATAPMLRSAPLLAERARRPSAVPPADFHFVPEGSRKEIARAIKSIIPHCPVIMIAVPYDAFEAVVAEPDLGGRIWHLELKPWNDDELEFIASAGFEVLNLNDPAGRVGKACTKESMGSPFLMQQLCFEVCTAQGILQRPAIRRVVHAPDQWESFLERLASRTRPPIFLKLLAPVIHGTFDVGCC